ncbi:type IX secretion system membrane protein PorP/SprF [Flavobacterium sp. F-65]|jgi:type IX secretion system PorP/SprF family membrane protein|uniref:Type IX secretion system membrane protein PorP/SprF n=1 Tax=Flavobacterium pisciphilum TaxID=2893755 RepID=A0ABS8MZW8_9FLAO|nr:type IX secretion system membrane protein PorP/SprF [Flavobacterium sp. F-65]MCC9074331.1 type IX secretion system membrane protein PorP/SprF [Flavobacterium sp. F-65]
MEKKKIRFILLVLFFYNALWSQQDSQYTHYMYNTTSINPAYAGSRGVMSIFGLHRNQWVGLDGAPLTNVVSFNTPINNSNVGLGISVINDQIGPMVENDIAADFSYTINTSANYKLSFGLKATAGLLNVDYTKLNVYDPTDPEFQNNIDNKFSPNIGAGVYLHSDKFYVGLSLPKILENSYFDKSAYTYVARERINYYLMAGYVFDLDYNLKFKPSLLTKVVDGAPLQMDISANFLFDDKFTAGVAYRWSAALSAMVGFQVTDGLLIGYAYDAETTKLANYNSGSHEIFLRFELFKNYDRIISPRFF